MPGCPTAKAFLNRGSAKVAHKQRTGRNQKHSGHSRCRRGGSKWAARSARYGLLDGSVWAARFARWS
eukprot:652396-Alexandrium_andersonii.AAC.1